MIRRKTVIRSRKRGTHLQLGLYRQSHQLILTTLQYYDKKEDGDKNAEERNSPTTRSLPSIRSADTNYITILG